MLRGRLGLETARIPHADRHGLLWLSRGALTVRDGTLRFERRAGANGGGEALDDGEYGIPFQTISMVLLGPGSTVSHDALRLMARHGTALVAVGVDGVRCYTAPPLMPDTSETARRQMRAWGDPDSRIAVARKMYALRLGEILPDRDITALRGMEGYRMRRTYENLARRYGIEWRGRRYDRGDPLSADIPNQAINHASVAVTSAAAIAVISLGAIPQLGFIHEHSGDAFALDIADLFRDDILLPAAFRAARAAMRNPSINIERHTRRLTGDTLRDEGVIPKMIDRIRALFEDVDAAADGAEGAQSERGYGGGA